MVKIKGLARFRCGLAPVATEVETNRLPSQLVVEAEFLAICKCSGGVELGTTRNTPVIGQKSLACTIGVNTSL